MILGCAGTSRREKVKVLIQGTAQVMTPKQKCHPTQKTVSVAAVLVAVGRHDGDPRMRRALLFNVGRTLPHALLTAASAGGHSLCPHFSSDETKGHEAGGAKTQTLATSVPTLAHVLKPFC